MIESGFPGLSLSFWAGLWAPAGTPAPVVAKLNAEINAVLRSPEMKAAYAAARRRGQTGSPQDFAAFIADGKPNGQSIVRVSGVKVE